MCYGPPSRIFAKDQTPRRGQVLGQEDPLEKEMATHFSILAWEVPRTEEPGGLQSIVSQKSQTRLSTHRQIPRILWGRAEGEERWRCFLGRHWCLEHAQMCMYGSEVSWLPAMDIYLCVWQSQTHRFNTNLLTSLFKPVQPWAFGAMNNTYLSLHL